MPKGKNEPLNVKVEKDVLVIRIGIDVLADSAKNHSDWRGVDDEPLLTVTDNLVFAQSIAGALQREEEDGTTPIDTMLDDAITHAVENGEEGVDLREDRRTTMTRKTTTKNGVHPT